MGQLQRRTRADELDVDVTRGVWCRLRAGGAASAVPHIGQLLAIGRESRLGLEAPKGQ